MSHPGWRVREEGKGHSSRFADRLVVEGGTPGLLRLTICREFLRGLSVEELDFLGPLAGACTSEGIRRDTGLVSWLHWPNNVTVGGLVVARTSCDFQGGGARSRVVFSASVDCSSREGAPSQTSLLRVLGVELDRGMLRDKVLHAFQWYCDELERGMRQELLRRVAPTIPWLGGQVVVVLVDGGSARGRASGLDDEGRLLLVDRRGGTLHLRAGDVRLVEATETGRARAQFL